MPDDFKACVRGVDVSESSEDADALELLALEVEELLCVLGKQRNSNSHLTPLICVFRDVLLRGRMVMTHFVEVVAQIKLVAVELMTLVSFLFVVGIVLFLEADNFLMWVRSRSRRRSD